MNEKDKLLGFSTTFCLAVGAITGLMVWTLHQVHEARSLERTEERAREKDVRFPLEVE